MISKVYQRNLLPFTAVVLILVIATGFLLYKQNSQPLSNPQRMDDWETYSNKNLGFSIKHPSNLHLNVEGWENTAETLWTVRWDSITKEEKERLYSKHSSNPEILYQKLDEAGLYSINVYIENNPRLKIVYTTIDEPLTEKNWERMFMDPSETKHLQFQGRPVLRHKYSGEINYYILDGKRLIRVTGSSNTQKVPDSYIDQILSTFGFIEQDKKSTDGWNKYSDKNLSFMYPRTWIVNGKFIIGDRPDVAIIIADTTGLSNECMKVIAEEIKNGLTIKKFTGVGQQESRMCDDSNKNFKQIWIVPNKDTYFPGISYRYSTNIETSALRIFDQILSTFKFAK